MRFNIFPIEFEESKNYNKASQSKTQWKYHYLSKRFLPTLTFQDILFHFDGTSVSSTFIPQLVQTPNRKEDDGFPKIGSYFFFRPGKS